MATISTPHPVSGVTSGRERRRFRLDLGTVVPVLLSVLIIGGVLLGVALVASRLLGVASGFLTPGA